MLECIEYMYLSLCQILRRNDGNACAHLPSSKNPLLKMISRNSGWAYQ
jgi:hypothetical protein